MTATLTPEAARLAMFTIATEAEFQHAVESNLDAYHWDFYHDRGAMVCPNCRHRLPARNRPGMPDLVAVGEGILLLPELKRVGGRRRPDQVRWMGRLQRVERVVADFYDPTRYDELCQIISSGGRR